MRRFACWLAKTGHFLHVVPNVKAYCLNVQIGGSIMGVSLTLLFFFSFFKLN